MKTCVYTCITGTYDSLKEIKDKEKDIDYICYTNNKTIKSNTWEVEYIEDKTLTNVQLARKIKILGTDELKKYDMTVWIDADIIWTTSVKEFINKFVNLNKYDLVGFKHYCRNTINEELTACFELDKITLEQAQKVANYYFENGYKDDNGLIESTLLFRNMNNKRLMKTMNDWFEHILNLTHRDQLSFNYVANNNKLKTNLLDINIWNNNYFTFEKHNKVVDVVIYYENDNKNILHDAIKINDIGNKNKFSFKVQEDTNLIKIKFETKNGLIINSIKCEKTDNVKCNNPSLENNYYSCYGPIIFELNGDFKKGEIIKIEYSLEVLDIYELTDRVSKGVYSEDLIKIKDRDINILRDEIKTLRSELNSIYNSTSMKITKPLRDFRAKISRK